MLGAGDSILLLEDDAAFRRIAKLRLESVGISCFEAATHAEVFQAMDDHPQIKVVLVDYDINGVGPAALVARLQKEWPHVILVGQSNLRRAGDFVALNVARFLLKPWTPDELFALITGKLEPPD